MHRLDNQTQGLLIIAKTYQARIALGTAFERREIHKKYRAIVIGDCPVSGVVKSPINDKPAVSKFSLIEKTPSLKFDHLALIELEPITGRTHQLRIHCLEMGHPILGDKLYQIQGKNLQHKGLFLQAFHLDFIHPITKLPLTFQLPIPYKFTTRMQNELRRFNDFQTNNLS